MHARIAGEPEEELRAYLTSRWNDYRENGLVLQAAGERFVACRIQDESVLTDRRLVSLFSAGSGSGPARAENHGDLIVADEEEYRSPLPVC